MNACRSVVLFEAAECSTPGLDVAQVCSVNWAGIRLTAGCLLVGLWLATGLWTVCRPLNQPGRDSYDRAGLTAIGRQRSARCWVSSRAGQLVSGPEIVSVELRARLACRRGPPGQYCKGSVSVLSYNLSGERCRGGCSLSGVNLSSLRHGSLDSARPRAR